MNHIEAMKLAKAWFERNTYGDEAVEEYEALVQAIAEAEQQQPVAWVTEDGERSITHRQKQTSLRDGGACASTVAPFSVAAFSDPPPRQPLTDAELERLYDAHAKYQEYGAWVSGWFEFARAIEAAHGITKENT